MPELDALIAALQSKQDWATILPLAIAVMLNLFNRWKTYSRGKTITKLKVENARLKALLEEKNKDPK